MPYPIGSHGQLSIRAEILACVCSVAIADDMRVRFSTLVGVAYDTESHLGLCRAACNLDKVVPKLRLDWAVNLAYFSTEHHLIELPHHLTRAKFT
jgi:hypothetical protein